MKRWVVAKPSSLREVLGQMKEDPSAIAEGRVFLGKKRATSIDVALRVGDEVRVGAREASVDIPILWERSGVVACIKPAGIPTVPDHAGSAHSLVAFVAKKVGRADLRITSRLDREVSGVVMFALDAAAEQRLKDARARGVYHRRYLALGSPGGASSDWSSPIDEKESKTRYRVIDQTERAVMFAVEPVTGRTHQIRIHASRAGYPLLGDREYGGPTRMTLANGSTLSLDRIALHCARVAIEDLVAEAPVPDALSNLWTKLGGDAEAWNTALACEVP